MNSPSTSSTQTSATEAKNPRPLLALVTGKIHAVRDYKGSFYTQISTPAADEFSHPGFVEVRSKTRFGVPGDVLQKPIKCRISGIPNRFVSNDGQDVTVARLFLDLVE